MLDNSKDADKEFCWGSICGVRDGLLDEGFIDPHDKMQRDQHPDSEVDENLT